MAYKLFDVEYPSVTTILGILDKPALLPWASRCAVDYIRNNMVRITDPAGPHDTDSLLQEAVNAYRTTGQLAKDIGSLVHDAIERYIKRGEDPRGDLPGEVQNGFLAFLEWEKLNRVEWLRSELTLFCRGHGYAGTTDAIARINDRIFLLDFKTSKGIYDEYHMQAGAYLQAYQEMRADGWDEMRYDVTGVGILRLDKETGIPEFADITIGIERKTQTFNALVTLYYMMKRRRLANNPRVKELWG